MRGDSQARPADCRGDPALRYVLVTPARDEGQFIERTIRCVVRQTVRPFRWAIVDDGSSDDTARIAESHASRWPWIRLVRLSGHQTHDFAAKVRCFQAGLKTVSGESYEIVGNLDADMEFPPDYFAYLLARFAEDSRLGVAGTPFAECGSQAYDYAFTNVEHVSGGCQLFRRECYDDIGGYVPIASGGVDWVAVTTARMKGWRTRTFTERALVHLRPLGGRYGSPVWRKFRLGRKDYLLGNGLVWELFRSIYQMRYRPIMLGGMSIVAGYLSALIGRRSRPISPELLRFTRREQARRLRAKLLLRPGVREVDAAGRAHALPATR